LMLELKNTGTAKPVLALAPMWECSLSLSKSVLDRDEQACEASSKVIYGVSS
jgi:hypothetical protein